tara:strand:- start:437 stop:685 length:249 start_codon:yes stop_codon:yes gene_type:complete
MPNPPVKEMPRKQQMAVKAAMAESMAKMKTPFKMKSPLKGKKDACYHKVKRNSKVWPSAYSSGRLVQCRKVGAANYGKKKKK